MITVLKLGGELIEAPADRARTAAAVAALSRIGPLVVVHGAGKAIDAELTRRGTAPDKRDGIRITDTATLETVVAVLAGTANTELVAALVVEGVRAVGLTGADAGLGLSERVTVMDTPAGLIDPGLVGRPIPAASPALLQHLSAGGYLPVIASVGMTAEGALLNVNADIMAAHLAAALGAARLLVAGTTPGVLDSAGSRIEALDPAALDALLGDGTATSGMVAKLRACRSARDAGVTDVRIVDGRRGGFETGTALR